MIAQDAGPAAVPAPAGTVVPPGLAGALLRLDLRLRLAVEGQREEIAERARDPFRGLYISEEAVDALLASLSTPGAASAGLPLPAGDHTSRLGRLATLFDL